MRSSAGSAPPHSPPGALSPRLRVLVAEDEPVSRLRLVRTIEQFGHEVLVASDGTEAWQLFEHAGADVVVTDWLMPGLDGPELCRRIRSDSGRPYTYVIFTTSLEGQDNVLAALSVGADDYLVKPILTEAIEARLVVAQRVTMLHQERAQTLAHRETLLQVMRQFALEADPERILSAALDEAMRLLNTDEALLYRWDETDEVLTSVRTTAWRSARSLLVALGRGAAGRAAVERRPVTRAYCASDGASASVMMDAGLQTAFAVPLLHGGRLLGVLEVGCREAERIFSASESETLELLAINMSSALVAIEHTCALQALADTDPLTELANRRRATDVLKRYLNGAKRRGHSLSLAIVDLDRFKNVNDLYGHPAGDLVLQHVAGLLMGAFRDEDIVARWGGEEFLVGMYDMPQELAIERLEKVRNELRATLFTGPDGQQFSVTFSVGIAQFPEDGNHLLELYSAADAALYEAKADGRDRVAAASSIGSPAPTSLPAGPGGRAL